MSKQTFKPQLESLEARTLMAGDVTAYINGDDLVIEGDADHNGIAVYQNGYGDWVVSGKTKHGGALTVINNKTITTGRTGAIRSIVTFDGDRIDDVKIDLKGADDLVDFGGQIGGDWEADLEYLKINTGGGHDQVYIDNTHAGRIDIDTGSGYDYVRMEDVVVGRGWRFNDDLQIDTGSDTWDAVRLYNVHVNDDLRIAATSLYEDANVFVGDDHETDWEGF